MASNGDSRGGLLTAGGILSIVAGAFEVIFGGIATALLILGVAHWLRFFDRLGGAYGWGVLPVWLSIATGIFVILGIIAIVGGVSALRRKSFGLSLAGAICALVPLNLLGILAVIFVSLSKGEFEGKE